MSRTSPIIITCHNCDYDFEVYRHTIQEYNFVHIDENIEGDYTVKCPHCGQEHSFSFTAEITHYRYYKL